MDKTDLKLSEIGEKKLVQEILNQLPVNKCLVDGFGHDSAFIDISVEDDEVLLVNTDRSGANIAYGLGLADGRCVGDFGVSHAISDILASGGQPFAVSIALLLPPNEKVLFVKNVIQGAVEAAKKYGAFIAAGDTKHNPKFAMVVTALGKCHKSERLTRSGAQPGDLVVVTDSLGTMAAGLLAFKRNFSLDTETKELFKNALIFQNPPYQLARAVASERIAHAAMDNSDGLASSLYSLSESSRVGVVLDMTTIPIHRAVLNFVKRVGADPIKLAMASGDWRFIYAVPPSKIDRFMSIAEQCNAQPSIIGRFFESSQPQVLAKWQNSIEPLQKIENDRFGIGGTRLFQKLITTS